MSPDAKIEYELTNCGFKQVDTKWES
jgi:hypothetical protein